MAWWGHQCEPSEGGGGGMCCFSYQCCSGGCSCCYCGGDQFSGCSCLPSSCDVGTLCVGTGPLCLDTSGGEQGGFTGEGTCGLWCSGDSGQNVSGNADGTPIDECCCCECTNCCYCDKVCGNNGSGQGKTRGGNSGQSSGGGFGGFGGGGSGSGKAAQQPENQNNNNTVALASMFARLGASLTQAIKGAPQQNRAVLGKPVQKASILPTGGDTIIIIGLGVLLLSALLFRAEE